MEQTSELTRRLRRIPSERRADFLRRLQGPTTERRVVPLSFRQEQLWILNHLASLQVSYNLAFGFRLRGELDHAALKKAIDNIFARHSILRSVFPAEEDSPIQKALPPKPVDLLVDDLTAHDPWIRRDRLNSAIEYSARQAFDFESGPLVRLRLFELDETEHLLLWFTHYMVFDFVSARLILEELAELYAAWREERTPQLPDPTMQYADFAIWQRGWAAGEEAAKQLYAWRETLAGWQATDLSTDRPRPAVLDLAGAQISKELPTGLLSKSEEIAQLRGVRTEAVLIAAYAALLQRYTNQEEVMIGRPFRVTSPDGVERLVGNCENLAALRIDVSGDPTFEELVARVDSSLEWARQRSNVPFKLLLDVVKPARDPSRLPLVQVAFTYNNHATAWRQAADLRLELEQFPTGAAPFEVLLEVEAASSPQWIHAEYHTSLFEEESMVRLLDRFVGLLEAAVAEPDIRLSRLPIMSTAERKQVLVDWNQTEQPRSAELIHRVFQKQVKRRPEAIALVSQDGQMQYDELEVSANQLAWHLRTLGVGPERRVAIYLDRSSTMVEAILGVLKAGGAYVPIDPSYPDERIATILEDCDAQVVLTQSSLVERLPTGAWQVMVLDETTPGTFYPVEPPEIELVPDNLAYVIYTSGSTGRPKGVPITHANVTNFIQTVQRMFQLEPQDCILQFASLGFDVSVFEIFAALLTGAQLYVLSESERRSLDALARVMIEQEITVIDLPPAVMELLDARLFPKLRVAFVGGEAFTGELTTRWAAGCQFYNGYGPTETTVTVVAKRCEGVWQSSPPIGRAMDNHRAYALNANLEPVPIGVPGELAIAGAGLGRGYWRRPAHTAERFMPDPFGPPGSRLYRTGDLVKWLPSGELIFLGRVDRQVKVRGQRIELGEIESVLSELAQVRQTVVEAVKDPLGNSVLVAFILGRDGSTFDSEELRSFLARKLPPYMVPSLFIAVESIPLTPSGKVDTRALPPVDFSTLAGPADDDSLRSPTEKRVAGEVFAPLLAVSRFGIHDNFFALGGTSLQAIRVIPRVRNIFGVEIPVAEFFQQPTVAGVAAVVDRLLAKMATAISEDDLLAALTEVEGLSDEEIERRLSGAT